MREHPRKHNLWNQGRPLWQNGIYMNIWKMSSIFQFGAGKSFLDGGSNIYKSSVMKRGWLLEKARIRYGLGGYKGLFSLCSFHLVSFFFNSSDIYWAILIRGLKISFICTWGKCQIDCQEVCVLLLYHN